MRLPYKHAMTVAAHRGDSYNYYENTITAFEKSIEVGADMIETDVRLSKDGYLVLMHDAAVVRTTGAEGSIAEMTLEEIRALNAGDVNHPETVPLLEDVLKLCAKHNVMLNIEIKEYYSEENEARCAKCIDGCIALVQQYDMADRIVLNSFDAWVLEYVYKKHGKKYMLHGFYPYDKMSNVSINPDEYLYCACLWGNGQCDKANYDALIEKGIEPWIGASITQAYKLALCASYGAKLITTNHPADAIEKLEKHGYRSK